MAVNCHAAKREIVTFPDLSIFMDSLRVEIHAPKKTNNSVGNDAHELIRFYLRAPALHHCISRPLPAFRTSPLYIPVWIFDIAGLAVEAV